MDHNIFYKIKLFNFEIYKEKLLLENTCILMLLLVDFLINEWVHIKEQTYSVNFSVQTCKLTVLASYKQLILLYCKVRCTSLPQNVLLSGQPPPSPLPLITSLSLSLSLLLNYNIVIAILTVFHLTYQ